MAVTAMFYGRAKDTIIGDFTLAIYQSLLAFIPMKFIEDCIRNHKPIQVAKIHDDLDFHLEKNEIGKHLEFDDHVTFRTNLKSAQTDDIINLLAQQQTSSSKMLLPGQNGANKPLPPHTYTSQDAGDTGSYTPGRLSSIVGRPSGKSLPDLPPELQSDDAIGEGDKRDEIARATAIAEVRARILSRQYTCPYWCGKFAWCIIVIWTLIAAIITTIYCIWFDVELNADNELESVINGTECPATYYDIPEKTWISYNMTQSYIDHLLNNSANYSPYHPPEGDSFGSNMSTTQRFFYQLLLTYAISVLLTQPVILFIKAILRYRTLNKKDNVEINESLLLFYANNPSNKQLSLNDAGSNNVDNAVGNYDNYDNPGGANDEIDGGIGAGAGAGSGAGVGAGGFGVPHGGNVGGGLPKFENIGSVSLVSATSPTGASAASGGLPKLWLVDSNSKPNNAYASLNSPTAGSQMEVELQITQPDGVTNTAGMDIGSEWNESDDSVDRERGATLDGVTKSGGSGNGNGSSGRGIGTGATGATRRGGNTNDRNIRFAGAGKGRNGRNVATAVTASGAVVAVNPRMSYNLDNLGGFQVTGNNGETAGGQTAGAGMSDINEESDDIDIDALYHGNDVNIIKAARNHDNNNSSNNDHAKKQNVHGEGTKRQSGVTPKDAFMD